ncbi:MULTISPECIES: hypothetical protein [Ignavibacterium]|jgi:hypothetical protein|uniref:hypothetical protein n=1 Tax=Ignavibacterium TaxID=795750 RepID=UPI0025C3685B|nr:MULTISPECIES: hypothetical protein [Ignavibacterium]MBI5660687.1 hypothetical protein [Ignavibacterium album]
MSVLLDIFGSTFIGGMILLLIIKLNLYSASVSYNSDNELKLQQNAKTIAEILNYDLRKIGYNHTGTAILVADSTRIKFYADINAPGTAGHGVVDVVEYVVLDSTHASGTSNSRDVVVTRVVNNTDSIAGPSLGLVKLRFSYFNSAGVKTTVLDSIKYVKAEFWVEPTEKIPNILTGTPDSTFTYWEMTINPRNI